MPAERQSVWPAIVPWFVVGIIVLGGVAIAISYSPLLARTLFRRDAAPSPPPPSGAVDNAPAPDNTLTDAPDLPVYPGPDNDVTATPPRKDDTSDQGPSR